MKDDISTTNNESPTTTTMATSTIKAAEFYMNTWTKMW